MNISFTMTNNTIIITNNNNDNTHNNNLVIPKRAINSYKGNHDFL